MHARNGPPIPGDFHIRAHGLKVRSLILSQIVQTKFITTNADSVTDVHLDVFLSLIPRDDGHAGDEYGHADVGQVHAVIAARWRLESAQQARFACLAVYSAPNVLHGGGDDPAEE